MCFCRMSFSVHVTNMPMQVTSPGAALRIESKGPRYSLCNDLSLTSRVSMRHNFSARTTGHGVDCRLSRHNRVLDIHNAGMHGTYMVAGGSSRQSSPVLSHKSHATIGYYFILTTSLLQFFLTMCGRSLKSSRKNKS